MKDLTDVKKIRASLGMSQKQLADALGMSSRSVAAWEAGATVTPSVMKMLQQLLAGETPEPKTKQADSVAALINEIAEQRKLTAEAQRQTAQLLDIMQQLTERKP